MFVLVTGGAASGKSEYAERLLLSFSNYKYYIATMHNYGDDETLSRIEKHKLRREGLDITTIEKESEVLDVSIESDSTVLLECMSNLLANEMFIEKKNDCVSHIVSQIGGLKKKTENVIIVTNEVSSDGIEYDEFTRDYQIKLAAINEKLGKMADCVVEIVYGIPVYLKGEEKLCRLLTQ